MMEKIGLFDSIGFETRRYFIITKDCKRMFFDRETFPEVTILGKHFFFHKEYG